MSNRSPSLVWNLLASLGIVLLVAGVVIVALIVQRLPRPREGTRPSVVKVRWPEPHSPDALLWQVLQAPRGVARIGGPLAGRFRLAGTFFVNSDSAASMRKAILDDLRAGHQVLLAEGDTLDGVKAIEILDDHVRLREGSTEETIWLSFRPAPGAIPSGSGISTNASPVVGLEQTLETNRFGRRVGMNRWVIQRDQLVKYYQELLDDPERIAALYVSLKPNYKENAIAGYELDVAGEADFFKAIGMQQGDTIRKVNSMNMTSQKRAEYFIGEFMKNRVSAFVLDIEREGKPEKLIYLVR